MEGCSDGMFDGKRYFFCPAGKGYFCRICDIQSLESLTFTNPATSRTPLAGSNIAPPPLTSANATLSTYGGVSGNDTSCTNCECTCMCVYVRVCMCLRA